MAFGSWLRQALVFAALGGVLSSCGALDVFEERKPPPACPKVSIIGEASRVAKFRPGGSQDLTNLLFDGELTGLGGGCVYQAKAVVVDLNIYITGVRGPADTSRAGVADYFIAIVGPSREILAKENFSLRFDFSDNRSRVPLIDEVEQRIPLSELNLGPEYEVMVGFQLTPEELEAARRRRAQ